MVGEYLELSCWFIFLQRESSFSPHQNHHELNLCDISGENQSICFFSRPKLQFKYSRRWESTGRSIQSLDSFLSPCYHATSNSPGFQDWEQVAWHTTLKDNQKKKKKPSDDRQKGKREDVSRKPLKSKTRCPNHCLQRYRFPLLKVSILKTCLLQAMDDGHRSSTDFPKAFSTTDFTRLYCIYTMT